MNYLIGKHYMHQGKSWILIGYDSVKCLAVVEQKGTVKCVPLEELEPAKYPFWRHNEIFFDFSKKI